MKQGTSQELYKQAHDNHYKSKNIRSCLLYTSDAADEL